METRLIVVGDADALAGLHSECFGEARWNAEQIAASLKLETTIGWLIAEDHEIHGFLLCQMTASEVEILTFCTSLAARRRGIGKRLLAAVKEVAISKGTRRIYLEVATDNQPARTLYEKAGFKPVGDRPEYYRRGDQRVDAVILSITL